MPAELQSLPLRPQQDPNDVEPISPGWDDDMAPNQQPGLYDAIYEKLVRSEFSRAKFLPQDDFDELLTEEAIKEELDKFAAGCARPSLIEYISKYARKTFAILVIQAKVQKAVSLDTTTFKDEYLPIANEDSCLTSLSGVSKDLPGWRWFRTWTKQEKNDFCDQQWLYLAPVFGDDSKMEELHPDCRLPFLTSQSKGEGGSFSFLHKATIHHAHHAVNSDDLIIAIKELREKEAGADQRELDALALARQLEHPHIVRFVGGFRQNSTSYLLFQWAEGGSLRSYWNDKENWSADGDLISWTLEQIKGLVGAIGCWHENPNSRELNGRHGDLKPDNILMSSALRRGIFQIADLGLAKIHSLPTHARNKPSSTPRGTLRYRPPEADPKISRSYDMWGMGCIILEWIIWLVYGIEGLNKFSLQAFPEDFDAFWSSGSDDRPLRPIVVSWMKHMTDTCLADGEQCYSIALRRLLIFVRERLLVPDSTDFDIGDTSQQPVGDDRVPIYVTLASDVTSSSSTPGRAKSKDSCIELEKICSIPDDIPNYMHNPKIDMRGSIGRVPIISNKLLMPSSTSNSRLEQKPRDLIRLDHQRQQNGGVANTKNPYAIPEPLDVWTTHLDNLFAKSVFGILEKDEMLKLAPAYPILTLFCQYCSSTETGLFSRGSFLILYEKARASQSICSLCAIIFQKMSNTTGDKKPRMMLQEGSSLTTARGDPPLLSLVVGPSPGSNHFPDTYQRGFPVLPTPGSSVQFKLLKRWIKWCDHHHECKPTEIVMPRRLVDVNPRGDCASRDHSASNSLRLDCNTMRENNRYVALTHRWGDPALRESLHFLSRATLERWQRHLDLRMLPQTFKDAVLVTRSLGLRYLWVDALCIVQDDGRDLQAEIGMMEDVFRCAYVTLSATCATGSHDGFLKTDRDVRNHYPLSYANYSGKLDMIYLCDPIDDFKQDVEQSALSRRGWVFQERALSRRIIHFTKTQIYWECGAGIRCETLTTLYNHQTSFLSDPQFPDAMLKRYKGMRIAFFEEIYEKYSQLDFTHCTDRPLGMAGIETRFARLFGRAQYGILDHPDEPSYLRRSLLWRRADMKKELTKIKYTPYQQVFSWSWMAVMGPICFMDIPFGVVHWTEKLGSPFNEHEYMGEAPGALRGDARKFFRERDDCLFFDRSTDGDTYGKLQCVVLGTQYKSNSRLVTHYGLIVVAAGDGGSIFERVGVATFERDQTWMDQETPQWIRIM